MDKNYDCSGWASRANLRCSDGRVIMRDAFKDNDGATVPVVWNHDHNDPTNVLGHALLENRDEGVYAYVTFNDSETGKTAKLLVQHGDITAFSIYANQLKQSLNNVVHGNIREVSLVLAGANPGACIESVIAHGEESDEEAVIYHGGIDDIEMFHADENETSKKEEPAATESKENKTVKEVLNTLTEEQKEAVGVIIGMAISDAKGEPESDTSTGKNEVKHNEEGGNTEMKYNVFDKTPDTSQNTLSHADETEIIKLAKQTSVGSLKAAIDMYAEDHKDTLQHGFESYEALFPEYQLTPGGEPYTLERDQSWISSVMSKVHKSPISRVRTRHVDARIAELRANGYQKKGDYKKNMAEVKLLSRTTDPQTIYIKDDMNRDDITDITDFDVVEYQWRLMRHLLDEEIALTLLIGDGREEGDPDKIHEDHIRSIYNDDDVYTIHYAVDIAGAKAKIQGTNTALNFGDNYIYAEAIIEASLDAREKYKGSGALEFYCTQRLLNTMLQARDLNGRRIYDSESDLAKALNVSAIHTVEQFSGKTRTASNGDTMKLLGLFVNLGDYTLGSTKGGEITRFDNFDMDFNKYKYMLETRLSGALTKPYSAIALEEKAD